MDIARFLRIAFPPVAASDSPTTVRSNELGSLFFDFAPPRAFNFDQNATLGE